jgi:hypothetical protein
MTAEINDNEPVPKLTVKLRSEITEPEPFEYTDLKPAEPIVETENEEESTAGLEPAETTIKPEDDEEGLEEIKSVDIPNVQEHKPQRQRERESKAMTSPTESKSISRLHSELRKHSDARKKTDSAILDIRKELKDLLLIHHATIKDLQKQVAQMHKKIVTIDSSKKSTRVKTDGKKIAPKKKTSGIKKSKKNINIGKNKRKR